MTGLSTAAGSGLAAVAAAILSRKFGRGVKTDGFFAAYNVYLAIVLIASVVRVVALPRFVRASADRRLGREVGVWLVALGGPLAAAVVVAVVWSHGVAALLNSHAGAQHYAAELLPWVVASAAAQVLGGVAASALAALDDYGTAAFGFAFGSAVGLAVTVLLIDHGVLSFGWGTAVNGAVSLGVPLGVLAWKGGLGTPDRAPWRRLHELGEGIVLPVALQVLFLVGNRFASGIETGDVSTFSYAYLIAALLVQLTATSLALVSTVPFAREGNDPERAARHVVSVSWLSLAPIAAAAGVFAVTGAVVTDAVLGAKYGGAAGAELSRLVVYLAPWTIASVALTVAYPLLLVRGRARWLPAIAGVAVLVHVPIEWAGRAAFGLGGIAAGMAVTTALLLGVLLVALRALERTVIGVLLAASVCGGLAAVVFAVPATVLGPVATAVVGVVLYGGVMGAWRPSGLRSAWAYVRALQ